MTAFMWNGENYLVKMTSDMAFLLEFQQVSEWLGFDPNNNPFLVPPEVLSAVSKI